MKKITTLFFFFTSFFLSAQTVSVRVMDLQNDQLLADVKIINRQFALDIKTTGKTGEADVFVHPGDTLSIQKSGYFPMLIKIVSGNLDDHLITVFLVKTSLTQTQYKPQMQVQKESFESFEYHFLNDKLPEEKPQFHVMDHVDAHQYRMANMGLVNFKTINLDKVHPDYQEVSPKNLKNSTPYQLTKKVPQGKQALTVPK
jgi:hypothetical protein